MKKVLALVLTLAMLMSLAFVSTASAAEITDLRTYELTSREMETWNIHSSQLANDLNVLCNLIDGLLTNDAMAHWWATPPRIGTPRMAARPGLSCSMTA